MLGLLFDLWDKMSFNNKGMLKHEKISYNSKVIPWLKRESHLSTLLLTW
jgi:hypothetical protein